MPVVFSEVDKRTLFFANNHLWKTVDGGQSWKQISPDLTRKTWEIPKSVGKYSTLPAAQPTQRGVIYTIAPSYQDDQPHLGRHRRRPDPRDRRRRQDLDRRHAAAARRRGRRSR